MKEHADAARSAGSRQRKPFFICHWPYSVHAPFQSKPELIKKWKMKVDPKNPQHSPTMAAMIEVLDTNVGRLMKALRDNGLEENTIVIFTSDNGGNPRFGLATVCPAAASNESRKRAVPSMAATGAVSARRIR